VLYPPELRGLTYFRALTTSRSPSRVVRRDGVRGLRLEFQRTRRQRPSFGGPLVEYLRRSHRISTTSLRNIARDGGTGDDICVPANSPVAVPRSVSIGHQRRSISRASPLGVCFLARGSSTRILRPLPHSESRAFGNRNTVTAPSGARQSPHSPSKSATLTGPGCSRT